jgi:membrane fusion protein (multidrug efflux system)
LRAEFPNPDRSLLPGMYVRALLGQAVSEQAISVPQQAVLRSPQGASVMLVDASGKVISQPVKADMAQGDTWVVSEGLKAGDRVIVEGLQKVKPGATVKPVAWKAPLTATESSGTAQPASSSRPDVATSAAAAKNAPPATASADQKPKTN